MQARRAIDNQAGIKIILVEVTNPDAILRIAHFPFVPHQGDFIVIGTKTLYNAQSYNSLSRQGFGLWLRK